MEQLVVRRTKVEEIESKLPWSEKIAKLMLTMRPDGVMLSILIVPNKGGLYNFITKDSMTMIEEEILSMLEIDNFIEVVYTILPEEEYEKYMIEVMEMEKEGQAIGNN